MYSKISVTILTVILIKVTNTSVCANDVIQIHQNVPGDIS